MRCIINTQKVWIKLECCQEEKKFITFLPFQYLPPNERKEREVEKDKGRQFCFIVLGGTL